MKHRNALKDKPLTLNALVGRLGRDSSSSGPDLTSHFSVSLDYGSDSPLNTDQINFDSFKEKASDDDIQRHTDVGLGSQSYQEAIGKSSVVIILSIVPLVCVINYVFTVGTCWFQPGRHAECCNVSCY